jgi:hypothetical protein
VNSIGHTPKQNQETNMNKPLSIILAVILSTLAGFTVSRLVEMPTAANRIGLVVVLATFAVFIYWFTINAKFRNWFLTLHIVAFVRRYWKLSLWLVATILCVRNDTLLEKIGFFVYLPALGVGLTWCALLVRHIFFNKTLDAYVDNRVDFIDDPTLTEPDKIVHVSNFTEDFHRLDGRTKVILTMSVTMALILAIAIGANVVL